MSATLAGLDTRVLFTALVALVAVMRLVELAVSRRNIARLRARGAVEVGAGLYPFMVAVHAAFLPACIAEVWVLKRPFVPVLGAVGVGLLVGAAALRWWVIATLGDRWSTRVLVLPGEPAVDGGPFRWLRHPNYLAVVVEFVALPMVHAAWLTAVVFSAADAAVLRRRIRTEEAALAASVDGPEAFGGRARYLPGAE